MRLIRFIYGLLREISNKQSKAETFNTKDLVYFVPYLVYVGTQIIETAFGLSHSFIIPYTIIYIIDRFADAILEEQDSVPFLENYSVIGLSALLFYIILYHMIISPKAIIKKSDTAKYKTSTLKKEDVLTIQQKLTTLFEVDKFFTNPKLTVNDVAKQLGIPRQHLSEVLNIHMKTSFYTTFKKLKGVSPNAFKKTLD